MSIIDELISKGKLKKGNYSEEMCKKEYNVGKKDLEAAKSSYETENYKESYSKSGASNLIEMVSESLKEIEEELDTP